MYYNESVKKTMSSLGGVDYSVVRNSSRLSGDDYAWAGITHSLSLLQNKKF